MWSILHIRHLKSLPVDTYGSELPTTWYTVFKSKSSVYNYLRRYTSHFFDFPLPAENTPLTRKRRAAAIQSDDKIRLIVGNNGSCIEYDIDETLVCNGPLGVGLSYR